MALSLVVLALLSLLLARVEAQQPCSRFAAGSAVANPPEVASVNGLLNFTLNFNTFNDTASGVIYHCYTTNDGAQGPTLRVSPGDRVVLTLFNNLSASPSSLLQALQPVFACGGDYLDPNAINMHFHGLHIPPLCHQDNAVLTIVNPGDAFVYDFTLPLEHPPGLYWYHPHIMGSAETFLLGGASGAIVVEGLQSFVPQVAGLDERILVVRDTPLPRRPVNLAALVGIDPSVPVFDISVNYVPVPYPGVNSLPTDQFHQYIPAVIAMRPGEQQLWRIISSAATTSLVLQLQYDGVPQPFTVVALDGRPVVNATPLTMVNLTAEAAARFDVIVTAPTATATVGVLWTLRQNSGILGDSDPARPLLRIVLNTTSWAVRTMPAAGAGAPRAYSDTVAAVMAETPAHTRLVYFDEDNADGEFFMVIDGMVEQLYTAGQSPSIIATSNTVEDWVVENHSEEEHEFHIHQIHFVVYQVDHADVAVPQFQDTVRVPGWTGSGPYPSVTLRMDFTGPIVGNFLFHCHIAEHEDGGMMAVIRIVPAAPVNNSLSAADIALIVISTVTALVGVYMYWAYRQEMAKPLDQRIDEIIRELEAAHPHGVTDLSPASRPATTDASSAPCTRPARVVQVDAFA